MSVNPIYNHLGKGFSFVLIGKMATVVEDMNVTIRYYLLQLICHFVAEKVIVGFLSLLSRASFPSHTEGLSPWID